MTTRKQAQEDAYAQGIRDTVQGVADTLRAEGRIEPEVEAFVTALRKNMVNNAARAGQLKMDS